MQINVLETLQVETIRLQCEDFGGSIAFPFYGFSRPSIDYYQSNLIIHSFVVSDINSGINHIVFYDERGQDKGADAVCSLRLKYHLEKVISGNCPDIDVGVYDSCVGQNKSQTVLARTTNKSCWAKINN